jgi:NAD+ diphosphatase
MPLSRAMPPFAPLPPNIFAGVPLDRAAHLRDDDAWLAARLGDPTSRFIVVSKTRNLVIAQGEPRAFFHSRASLDPMIGARVPLVLLGVVETGGTPQAHFAIDLSHLPDEDLLRRSQPAELMDLRQLVQIVPGDEAALLAYARGLLHWHSRHQHCGVCGSPTLSTAGGHQRACTNLGCRASHFPRTDAAVIVLIHDGARCLLARQSKWPPGMHSTLAGFLEPGESFEECVAREVREESGIELADIRYHSSQPWPFPSSIMVGFFARAVGGTLKPDPAELERAAWYGRAELKNMTPSNSFRLPNAYSIAYRLIQDFMAERFPSA